MTATPVALAVRSVMRGAMSDAYVLNDGKTYVRCLADGRLVCLNHVCIQARTANECEHVRVVAAHIVESQ